MTDLGYDEDEVLRRYLAHNLWDLMTDFERRCYTLAMQREKAEVSEVVAARLPSCIAEAGEDVVEALERGARVVRQEIEQRIADALEAGTLTPNRCPECHRIVRTPLAQQCLWCGHDWHGT